MTSEPELTLTSEGELTVLQMVERSHREEIKHHRELQFRAFSWTNSLFLAIFGGIVAARGAKVDLSGLGSLILTIMVTSITATTLMLIARSERALEANAAVVVAADRRMHLFSPGHFGGGESLYPRKWLSWGSGRRASIETWFYMVNTLILGTAIVVGAWTLA